MGKPVIYAQLHTGFFVPGIKNGNFKETLPAHDKTLKNFKMTLEDSGTLSLEWEDGVYTKHFSIAAANVKVCQHPPTEVKAQSKSPIVAK